jgi:putative SOS response-associated peptidase YedK
VIARQGAAAICGRFFLQRDPAGLAAYFETSGPVPNHAASWNIAPTQDSLVVRRHPETGLRHLSALRWGLVPRWAKDTSDAARLMNARAEGIAEKPSFRDAFLKRRCLVPMDGFYEWMAPGPGQPGRAKQAYAVALASGDPMAVAGLWEGWKSPEGEWLRSFTVITTESNARQALIHPRMPAILPREAWPVWLGESIGDPQSLLRPCAAEWLRFWPIASRVGRVSENDPQLLDREAGAAVLPELDDPPARR